MRLNPTSGLQRRPKTTARGRWLVPRVLRGARASSDSARCSQTPKNVLTLTGGEAVREMSRESAVMDDSCKTQIKYTEGVKEDLKAVEAASSAQNSAEGCGSCPGNMWRFIPPVYRTELVELFKLAGPVVRPSCVINVFF